MTDGIMTLSDRARAWVTEILSEPRARHSFGVAATARELAERYGADPDRCELAGLLHDVAREWGGPRLTEAARAEGLDLGYMEEMAPMPCLHGPVGAALVRDQLGVDDEALLRAIANHTLGRERMSLEEKIVFLADAIEPNRPDAPYVRDLREAATVGLDLACRRAYDHTFEFLLRTGQPIHPDAARGRNWLIYCERHAAPAAH